MYFLTGWNDSINICEELAIHSQYFWVFAVNVYTILILLEQVNPHFAYM